MERRRGRPREEQRREQDGGGSAEALHFQPHIGMPPFAARDPLALDALARGAARGSGAATREVTFTRGALADAAGVR